MKFDTWLLGHDLRQMPGLSQQIEAMGFDGMWTAEAGKDPFFPLLLAAEHTQKVTLGTSIATAFPRTPTILAHMAWDLAAYSNGRFILGLGTQVRAHNERRLGVTWEKPIKRMRETIEAMHAIWDCWQNGTPLRYEGEFFNLSLMTPFFSGQPLTVPRPPVYISAINEQMLKLAGKVCDGAQLHPFHSLRYLKEFALPMIEEGLRENGRLRTDFTANGSVFVIPTDGEVPVTDYEAHTKGQMAYYMSTPAYRVVLEMHGWTEVGKQLSMLARQGAWDDMPKLLTDEMVDTFAISGKWSELPQIAKVRYDGVLDRLNFYLPYKPGADDAGWAAAIAGFKSHS
ncbi:MAG: TIGR03617 family F420-dependent LLM class oxidoreductase [Ardenticatenaceae bacterium]|nr:TIGR03617 family F420-dependent LLM class oxidoreductase [Ardenticatenaceae bacterium]